MLLRQYTARQGDYATKEGKARTCSVLSIEGIVLLVTSACLHVTHVYRCASVPLHIYSIHTHGPRVKTRISKTTLWYIYGGNMYGCEICEVINIY